MINDTIKSSKTKSQINLLSVKYIVANWKANKDISTAKEWLRIFIDKLCQKQTLLTSIFNQRKIIICPPFPLIPIVNKVIKDNLPQISVGSQDISRFEKGNYTGETTVFTLSKMINYTLIGHSERRKYFPEKKRFLKEKIRLAKKYNIEPIYCLKNENDPVPPDIKLVAYEPMSAIGTGKNQDVATVTKIRQKLVNNPNLKFLYGGSVDENNAFQYLKRKEIDGLLVGTASLNGIRFFNLIKNSL